MIALFEQVGYEAGWIPRLTFSPEHLAEHLAVMVSRDEFLAIGCVPGEGEPVCGLLIAEIGAPWYTPSRIAAEKVFYVHPAFRQGGVASALIQHYVEWARGNGAAEILIGNGLGIRADKVKALCESQGFDAIGYIFKQIQE